jgi:tetratricopeptide (TPR) repeat protein
MTPLYDLNRIMTDPGYLFNREEPYTFLFGAGISMDPPSSLPSASEIVKNMLKEILKTVPDRLVKNLLSNKSIRYEMIIEELIKIDPDLKFLDYLELVTKPNLLHYFIAHCILHGYFATTTNFDYLIEHAMYNLLPKEKHEMFVTIADKNYYGTFYDAYAGKEEGVYYLLKLHGAKNLLRRNIDKNEFLNIQKSLNTTMSSFNRGKGLGAIFGVEDYKKKLVHGILNNRILVVMGYSAGDNIDIVPFIRSEKSIKSIIWIEHSSVVPTEVYQLTKGFKHPETQKLLESNPTLTLLLDIYKQNRKAIFYIRGNTASIIKDFLWEKLLGSTPIPEELKYITSLTKDVPVFSEYVKGLYPGLHLINRFLFALNVSLDLRNFDDALAIIEEGSEIAQKNNNMEALYLFEEKRAEILLIKGERDIALKMFMEMRDEYKENRKWDKLAYTLMKISEIEFEDCLFERALYPLVEAEELFIQNNDKNGLAWHSNMLGKVNTYKGEYSTAEAAFENALFYNSDNGDIGLKADILKNQSNLFAEKGLYLKALEKIDLSLETCKILNDPIGITEKLTLKASIINKVGNKREASNLIYESYEISKKLNYEIGIVLAKTLLARIEVDYSHMPAGAGVDIREAIEICKKINFSLGLREALLTSIYISTKGRRFNDAVANANKALDFNEKISDLIGRARIVGELANTYYKANHEDYKEQIEKYLKYAISINRKLQQQVELSSNLLVYGKFYIDQQRYEEATQKLSESLEIRKNLEFKKGEAEIFRALGNLHFQKEEYEKSLEYYLNAMEFYTEMKDDEIIKALQEKINQLKKFISKN